MNTLKHSPFEAVVLVHCLDGNFNDGLHSLDSSGGKRCFLKKHFDSRISTNKLKFFCLADFDAFLQGNAPNSLL